MLYYYTRREFAVVNVPASARPKQHVQCVPRTKKSKEIKASIYIYAYEIYVLLVSTVLVTLNPITRESTTSHEREQYQTDTTISTISHDNSLLLIQHPRPECHLSHDRVRTVNIYQIPGIPVPNKTVSHILADHHTP